MSEENGQKRKPKNPIKFLIQLNEEQKSAKQIILESKITVLKGQAGSGKSLVAAQVALDLLFKREVERVVLTRPAVNAGEELGYMPGDKDAKLAPYTATIFDQMYRMYSKDKIDKEITDGHIEVIPLGFMRGRNFTDCCVVIDEAQNVTQSQTQLLLGRLCHGSKMIFCGDSSQIDLKDKRQSGFDFMCKHLKGVNGFSVVTLRTNHRDPIVEEILKIYKEYDN